MTFVRLFSADLPNVVERIGWVLVHSLWQFGLLAMVIALSLRAMRRRSAVARYSVLVAALATSVTAPMATWTLQPGTTRDHSASRSKSVRQPSSTLEALQNTDNSVVGDLNVPTKTSIEGAISDATSEQLAKGLPAKVDFDRPKTSWIEVVTALVRPWLPWIVAGWIVGVVLCSLRPLLGWQMLRHLRTVGVSAVSDDVQAAVRRASDRLGLCRAVEVLQSTLVQVPVVVGYLRPIILLPISLLTSIPPAQLEAILAHELAHVRRHDFVVNLLQTLIETLFFYHPAIWWLSHQIRVEREHCCDDLVVKSLGNHVEYGRALLAIAELHGNHNVLALGATDGSLLSRVQRIFGVRSDGLVVPSNDRWLAGLLCLVCLGLILALSFSSNLVANNDDTKNTQPALAQLPGGIEVELVGVGFHPSKDREWWTPDGGELRQRPRLEGETSVMPNSPQQAQCREFLIQIRGLPSNHSVKIDYGSMAAATGSRYSDGLWTGEHAAGPFKSKVTSIRVGLTTEPYGPIVSFDATGRKQGLEKLPEELRACYGLLVPGGIEDSNGRIELLLENGPLNELGKLAAWELDAVDVDGKKHRSSSQFIPASDNKGHFVYDLPRERLARLEYRLRPYRHWVTFKGISLEPGQETNVTVSVETIPQAVDTQRLRKPGADRPPVVVTSKPGAWKLDGDVTLEIVSKTDDEGHPLTTGILTWPVVEGPPVRREEFRVAGDVFGRTKWAVGWVAGTESIWTVTELNRIALVNRFCYGEVQLFCESRSVWNKTKLMNVLQMPAELANEFHKHFSDWRPAPVEEPSVTTTNSSVRTTSSDPIVIKRISEQDIEFEGFRNTLSNGTSPIYNRLIIPTDAETKFVRLTEKGEEAAERKDLKVGLRVNLETMPGTRTRKIVILAAKQEDGKKDDETNDAPEGDLRSEQRRGRETLAELANRADLKTDPRLEKPINDLTDDVKASEVLLEIAKQLGLKLQLDQAEIAAVELEQRLSANTALKDVYSRFNRDPETAKLSEWSRAMMERGDGTITGREVLKCVLEPLALDFHVEGNVLHVSTLKQIAKLREGDPDVIDKPKNTDTPIVVPETKPQILQPGPVPPVGGESSSLQIIDHDSIPLKVKYAVSATKGFPNGAALNWFERPNAQGLISLEKLPMGKLSLYTDIESGQRTVFATVVREKMPRFTHRARRLRTFEVDDIAVVAEVTGEFPEEEAISVKITNESIDPIEFTAQDVSLTTFPDSYRVFWPRDSTGNSETFKMKPGETVRLEIEWPQWIREGFWATRKHEIDDAKWSDKTESGKIQVRIELGNQKTEPIFVASPQSIISQPAPILAPGQSVVENRIRVALDQRLSLDQDNVAWGDVLGLIKKRFRFEIVIDAKSLADLKLDLHKKISIKVNDVKLHDVIAEILSKAAGESLGFVVEDKALVIKALTNEIVSLEARIKVLRDKIDNLKKLSVNEAGAVPVAEASENILLNPGFEEGDRSPAKWTSGAKIEGVTYLWDKDNGKSGKASLCLEKTADRYFPIAQWFQIVDKQDGGQALKVSAQVKAENAHKAIIDVIFLDEKSEWISHEWASFIGIKEEGDKPATHDWKEYGGEVKIPAGTKKIQIGLQIYGPGKVWFDDVRAEYVK